MRAANRRKKKKKESRKRPGCLGRLFRFGAGLAAILLLAVAGAAGWWYLTWPAVGLLARQNPETTAFVEQRIGQAGRSAVRWSPVSGEAISDQLRIAVLVAEDIGFFDHQGFARDEIEAALRDTIEKRKPLRGASTITQQLAKNLWLSPSRNPLRKLREALLTMDLERTLSKERILDLYLNVAEFGPGVFGAEAASRHFFGKPAAGLSAEEAAGLAAGLSRPSQWHPGCGSEYYRKHVGTIRQRMAKARGLPFDTDSSSSR
jgi:monofunctional biosynthetic peptidoglycan transglycosylase